MQRGRVILCAKWHCIAWNKQVYSVVFFSVFPKKMYESEGSVRVSELIVSVSDTALCYCALPLHSRFGFVMYCSCMLFLKQKSLLIRLFTFLPCVMKANLRDFCWSGVVYDIYNFSTVLQLLSLVAVMQVFPVCNFEWHCFHDAYFADVLYVNSPCSDEYLWNSDCEMTCSLRH
jgi:hypothetical protein